MFDYFEQDIEKIFSIHENGFALHSKLGLICNMLRAQAHPRIKWIKICSAEPARGAHYKSIQTRG